MYHAHFGLQKGLFEGGIAHEDAVFVGPRQQLVIANFKVALTTFDSVIVLTGAAGGGKTTLTSTALRTTSTRLALGWLASTPTNGPELIELLLTEFGLSAHRVGRVERLQMWRQFLNEMSTTDSRVFVIAEHADEMETEALRTLEGVTAADPNGCLGANVILLGQPELNDRLKLPALASLNQRVRLRQLLPSFSAEELEAYLKHRVTLAGGSFDKVFTRDAIGALLQYSGGVPRVVNNLCETALTLAATGAEQRVTQQLVMRVAIGLYGIDSATAAAPVAIAQPGTSAPTAAAPTVTPPAAAVAPRPAAAPPAPTANIGPAHTVTRPPVPRASPEFPVLTDAIEAPGERKPQPTARIEPKQPAQPVRREPPHAAPAQGPAKATPAAAPAKAASTAPAHSAHAAPRGQRRREHRRLQPPPLAHEPARPPAAAVAAAQAPPARPPAAKAPQESGKAESLNNTQTMRALASAKSIDDISSSMAETLFGDADLDMLSAALASAGWAEDAESDELLDEFAATSVDSATMETPKGKFDSFGQIPELLELVDDSPTGKNRAPKIAGQR